LSEVSPTSSSEIPDTSPPETPTLPAIESAVERDDTPLKLPLENTAASTDEIAEVVFFTYGVAVFFGLNEGQEKIILEDIETAGIFNSKIDKEDWEVEECHFAVRFYACLWVPSNHLTCQI
jgi:uncharacterized Rmd1/YagE family protein